MCTYERRVYLSTFIASHSFFRLFLKKISPSTPPQQAFATTIMERPSCAQEGHPLIPLTLSPSSSKSSTQETNPNRRGFFTVNTMSANDEIRRYLQIPSVSAKEALAVVQSDKVRGLNDEEVARRRKVFGKNELPEEPPKPLWELILQQFEDVMVRLLVVAAVVSLLLAVFEEDEDEKLTAYIEPLVIVAILTVNAAVGVVQELNADEALRALLKLSAPKSVVIRNGEKQNIDAAELVPGDIVVVAAGDQIPADCRVIDLLSTTIRIDQATLTGECDSIVKHNETVTMSTGQQEFYLNVLYSTTCVTYGSATCVVMSTGLSTAFGNVYTSAKETEEEKTPLQQKLDDFGELLTKVITAICAFVWIVNIGNFSAKGTWLKGCVFFAKQGVALAVAALPEGLPAVVTTCLALGTRRMAKKHALVRKLPSVETLGCTTVICSDKTGTLTTNKMVVRKVCTYDGTTMKVHGVRGTSFNPVDARNWEGAAVLPSDLIQLDGGAATPTPLIQNKAMKDIALVSTLCNEASLTYNEETKEVERVNEAMEAALRVFVEKVGLDDQAKSSAIEKIADPNRRVLACNTHWGQQFKKNGTLEFTRERKSMSVHASSKGTDTLFVKGAPDCLVERCTHVKTASGEVKPLTADVKRVILATFHELASGGESLRCLGMAVKNVASYEKEIGKAEPEQFAQIESGLTFVGFVGILDPPRPEVKEALNQCATAHVRVIVITGGIPPPLITAFHVNFFAPL